MKTVISFLGGIVLLWAAALATALPVHAQGTGSIRGTVTTMTTGEAGGVLVRLVGQDRSATSDAQGRFLIDGVPAGTHLLEVHDERRGQGSARVVVTAGGTAEVEIVLSPLFRMDALVVTAGPLASRQDELFQAARVVGGRELRNRIQPSLGETLANEPGLSSTYFGPGSSRPLIRGLGGDRVRVLENGVGTGDAANTSPDHAVTVDPSTAERIEVVRGPATLLYGSSAIGGVVNVVDGRVPTERPTAPVSGEVLAMGGTAAEERATSGHLLVNAGPLVLRGAGSWRDTEDYDIPGFAELAHEGEPPPPEEERGTLANSFTENRTFSFGASWLGERGYLGAAVTGYDQDYGVPGHEEEGGAGEEEIVTVDLRQRRFDLAGELRMASGPFEALRLRFGANDYRHFELEGPEIGTIFENDQWEGRIEGRHRPLGGIHGAVGVQVSARDFSTFGEEAFTPPNETDLFAAFLYEEADLGATRVQFGARYEYQESSESIDGFSESFDGVSLSAGVRWDASDAASLSLSAGRSVKLPTAEELFSNGPHLATRSFELGSRDLKKETAYSLDGTVHFHLERFRGEITGFLNEFSDFIFPAFTGNVTDGLQEVRFTQADARFSGLEARTEVELFHEGEQHLGLELGADYVRGTLKDDDAPIPRIPPFRLSAGVRYEGVPWQASFTLRQVSEQDRVADFEEATPGHTMLDASLGYRLFAGRTVHEIVLQGRNLTDEDARVHASLLKEVAPLPGRDLRLMYRVAF
ncbi:MAG: TonB-dependent receptor [Longimicrobiales bacterium]|nr:TonB-dependent receptor [Longimicrobiales bacterium]